MLMATNLGQPGTLSPEAQAQAPVYTSILQRLRNAEDDLQMAYSNIALMTLAGTDLPLDLLRSYNTARAALLEGANDWIKARDLVDPKDLPDPGKKPVPPPLLKIPTSGTSGLGAAEMVPAQAVQVVYGPVGEEKTLPLGDPMAASVWPRYGMGGDLGVPIPALGVVLVLLGVALVLVIFAMVVQQWTRAKVEANRAKAIESEALARRVREASDLGVKLQAACVGTSTDPAHLRKCTEKTGEAVERVLKGIPHPKAPRDKGLGFFGWVGAIVVIGGAAMGGYYLFRRRRRMTAGRFAPEADWPDEWPTMSPGSRL